MKIYPDTKTITEIGFVSRVTTEPGVVYLCAGEEQKLTLAADLIAAGYTVGDDTASSA